MNTRNILILLAIGYFLTRKSNSTSEAEEKTATPQDSSKPTLEESQKNDLPTSTKNDSTNVNSREVTTVMVKAAPNVTFDTVQELSY